MIDLPKLLEAYNRNTLSFESVAIEIYNFQLEHNSVFRDYCHSIGKGNFIGSIDEIVYLPISAYKSQYVSNIHHAFDQTPVTFTSSGTTKTTASKHYLASKTAYLNGAQQIFEAQYGPLMDYTIFALLPSYLERSGSSLVAMADHFIKIAGGGFYLDDYATLSREIADAKGRVLLIGVSFALLDLAERGIEIKQNNLIVMETGGMKGRRKEISRDELHQILSSAFGCDQIHSEYGMTELCSQAYSSGDGIFDENPWMKINLREVTDPFSQTQNNKPGVIQVIDLNNYQTCSFIETEDLGRRVGDNQFTVLGRLDNSDVRGCNLLVL